LSKPGKAGMAGCADSAAAPEAAGTASRAARAPARFLGLLGRPVSAPGRDEGFGQGRGRQAAPVLGRHQKIVEADRVAVRAEGRLAVLLAGQQGFLGREPARHPRQLERRQVGLDARGDAGQREVGGEAGQPGIVERHPGAQRAAAPAEGEGIVEVALPGGQVRFAQVGIEFAFPTGDVGGAPAEARMGEARAHVERLGQLARGRGLQGETVRGPMVLQHQADLAQAQRRRAALGVGPVDPAFADQDLALAKHPVATLAALLVLRVDAHAGDLDHAIKPAPHVQLRTDQFERLEARFGRQYAPPGKGGRDRGQRQHLAPGRIPERHVAQEQRGIQSAPGGVDAGDADLVAERAAGGALDVALIEVDVREDGVAQREEQQTQAEIHEQRQLDGEAEHMMRSQVGIPVGGTQPPPAFRQRHGRRRRRLRFRILHQGANFSKARRKYVLRRRALA
jgi:hypothetical protein